MKPKTKATVLTYTGYGLSAVAPLIATATQFPIFVQKGTGATVSGAFLLVALICVLPIFLYTQKLKKQNRTMPKPNTPALIWGIVLIACIALYQIIDELIIISASGLGGVGASKIMFAIAEKQAGGKTADTVEQVNGLLEVANETREES